MEWYLKPDFKEDTSRTELDNVLLLACFASAIILVLGIFKGFWSCLCTLPHTAFLIVFYIFLRRSRTPQTNKYFDNIKYDLKHIEHGKEAKDDFNNAKTLLNVESRFGNYFIFIQGYGRLLDYSDVYSIGLERHHIYEERKYYTVSITTKSFDTVQLCESSFLVADDKPLVLETFLSFMREKVPSLIIEETDTGIGFTS